MNWKTIEVLQAEYNVTEMQGMINSGQAWKMEGSVGRAASDYLTSGLCMLPLVSRRDYYGNYVPSRKELKAGTKGTYLNCKEFWSDPENLWDLAS